ncbi:hypothetical protein Tco_0670455, partial [Tanacetum coccineum]
LFNLDLQKDALVAQNFQNLDFAVSFRRYPRGGIKESQFQELSLLLSLVVLSFSSDDLFSRESWFNGLRLNNLQKLALEVSFFSMWWHIWKYRNAVLFSLKKSLKGLIFDNIVSQTWLWVKNRCRKFNVNWVRG